MTPGVNEDLKEQLAAMKRIEEQENQLLGSMRGMVTSEGWKAFEKWCQLRLEQKKERLCMLTTMEEVAETQGHVRELKEFLKLKDKVHSLP